ncbi:hypothetical protein ETD86_06220 [Nonomuraea turkmeniaca]|uniref:DUF8129 domain-containing protein n=1 Tax=Nonomuraea turkmeniaca TaxID=103838 RepID=A0A5S4FTH0_9ACTN|nr:hypothetical protein [Nonomuraea turkmeniaca]TMR23922.1 hypothetical protein ETD86_06220 [Nonomuraea turkmeniaca]
MSLSDVIRNIAKTVTNKDELKEKAKDLPLMLVQSTLSAAGQALLLVDRVKNSIKGLGNKEEREEEQISRTSAADQVAAPADEDKPARKEPVIFSPRPGAAEPNGVAKTKPDPVIFAPAGKEEPVATAEPEAPAAEPEVPAQPAAKTETAPKPVAKTEAAPEPVAETEAASKPATKTEAASKPATKTETASKPATKTETASKPATKTKAASKPAAKTKVVDEPAPAAEPKAAPAAPKAVAEPAVEAPAAPEAVAEPVVAEAPEQAAKPTEPLPGYDEMTVASLRARMRGKTAEQIGDFLAYERATQGRPEVVRMFENRLAKLQAGE